MFPIHQQQYGSREKNTYFFVVIRNKALMFIIDGADNHMYIFYSMYLAIFIFLNSQNA